ncbi:odorant receptor 131-2-like [Oreochromis niloticus]|uniref:odorant receptor 131-2-like n=1 Tax=Oreochromis niloticus TaxID=8128 RepID=UPI000DF1588A|nr:odorant receptor 131-2-like [Oreochromis niloticus]CAI5642529.1 unnamed protein product [Mustela putorius furo]
MIISTLTTFPSFIFLFINGTMLFTLRSKPVFHETPRYILLYNLLFAETVQLAQSQVLFLLSVSQVKLFYPVCGFLLFFTSLTTVISPLTLVVMPLERYVAVCYPLRHPTIITIRNTVVGVIVTWAVSSVNILIRGLLVVKVLLKLENVNVKDHCYKIDILLGLNTDYYDKAFTCVIFVSAALAIIFSYIGVVAAARSASADKGLARKARNTLLLNLVQLCLSLCATIYRPLLTALSTTVTMTAFSWIQNVFYVCLVVLPRFLTSLVYGLRDQTIRPVLMYHLCCHCLK